MATDEQSIFQNIIPNAFIKRIVLSNGGGYFPESNPHIDHERETTIIVDPETGRREPEPLSATIRRLESSNQLMVTLDVVIKERLKDGIFDTWFSNQDFLKYFKLKVVQSTSPESTTKIATKEVDINELGRADGISLKLISVKEEIESSLLDQYAQSVDHNGDKIIDITINTSFSIRDSQTGHLAYFAMAFIDLDAMAKDMDLELDNIPSVEGRIASELVLNEGSVISKSFIFRDPQSGQIWPGEVHQLEDGRWAKGEDAQEEESILEFVQVPNSTVQDCRQLEALAKLDVNLALLEGDVLSERSEGSALGLFNQQAIIDDRNKGSAVSSFYNPEGLSPLSLVNRKDSVDEKKSAYFTDLFMSRDEVGDARFLFGFNLYRFLLENSLYGKLYKNNAQQLFQNVRISGMRVFRERIVSDLENRPSTEKEIPLFSDVQLAPEIVASSGERAPGDFVTVNGDNGSLREIDLYTRDNLATSAVRYFTGIDKLMNKVTYGNYQYRVAIEIEDNTIAFLNNMVNRLLQAEGILKEYGNEAEFPGSFNHKSNRFEDRFIKNQREKYQAAPATAPWVAVPAAYLETLELLVDKFDSQDFEDALLFFLSPKTATIDSIQDIIKLIRELALRIADMANISLVNKSMKWVMGQSQHQPSGTKQRVTFNKSMLTIERRFASVFDSNIPKGVGYRFVSGDQGATKNNDGLLVISGVDFEDRANKETLKYYKAIDTGISLATDKNRYSTNDTLENNKFTYFSPLAIKFGPKEVKMSEEGTNIFNPKKYNSVMTDVARFNLTKKSPFVLSSKIKQDEESNMSADDQTVVSNLTAIMADSSVTIEPLVLRSEMKLEKAEDFVGTGSVFLREDKLVEEVKQQTNAIGSQNPASLFLSVIDNMVETGDIKKIGVNKTVSAKMDRTATIQAYNLKSENNVFSEEKKDSIEQDATGDSGFVQVNPMATNMNPLDVKMLPNQIKSLLVGSLDIDKVKHNWFTENDGDPLKDPAKKLMFRLNYSALQQIEVLERFEKSDVGSVKIKMPVWSKMTLQLFNNSRSRNLLCRMKPYNNNALAIRMPKGIDLPVYNEHFIISPLERVSNPAKPLEKRVDKITERILSKSNMQAGYHEEYQSVLNVAKRATSNKSSGLVQTKVVATMGSKEPIGTVTNPIEQDPTGGLVFATTAVVFGAPAKKAPAPTSVKAFGSTKKTLF